ncbi:GM26150 [Drosophila sechellia]|uniref:GM26150 n=1 Tax=Drosophila sechellia TaxID=7238 RepID=B4HIQ5_DROSE|nr:GM26150 [Drosophila sechellia]
MVYESGFTTRRTYSSRPVTTSYAVTYPSVEKVTRVYKSSYPHLLELLGAPPRLRRNPGGDLADPAW